MQNVKYNPTSLIENLSTSFNVSLRASILKHNMRYLGTSSLNRLFRRVLRKESPTYNEIFPIIGSQSSCLELSSLTFSKRSLDNLAYLWNKNGSYCVVYSFFRRSVFAEGAVGSATSKINDSILTS